MTPESVYSLIKKHGMAGGMAVALIWFNNRLNIVEERLYDCYEDKAIMRSAPISDISTVKLERLYAILPSKCKSVEECLA